MRGRELHRGPPFSGELLICLDCRAWGGGRADWFSLPCYLEPAKFGIQFLQMRLILVRDELESLELPLHSFFTNKNMRLKFENLSSVFISSPVLGILLPPSAHGFLSTGVTRQYAGRYMTFRRKMKSDIPAFWEKGKPRFPEKTSRLRGVFRRGIKARPRAPPCSRGRPCRRA